MKKTNNCLWTMIVSIAVGLLGAASVGAYDLSGEWEGVISGVTNRVWIDQKIDNTYDFYNATKLEGTGNVPAGSLSFFGDRRASGTKKCWIITGVSGNPSSTVSTCVLTVNDADNVTLTYNGGQVTIQWVRVSGPVVAGGCLKELDLPEDVICKNLITNESVQNTPAWDKFNCDELPAAEGDDLEITIKGKRKGN